MKYVKIPPQDPPRPPKRMTALGWLVVLATLFAAFLGSFVAVLAVEMLQGVAPWPG